MTQNVVWGKMPSWLNQKLFHKDLQLINGRFMTIFGHFFANFIYIFHKTEVQTVIFRCLTGLDLNLIKSYDTKRKKTLKRKKHNWVFFDKIAKKNEMEFFAFFVITFEPIKF